MLLKKVSIILVTTAILVACNIYTLIPLYSPISTDFHVPMNDIIWGSSFFTFFYALGLLSFGPISERIGRKKIIVFGLFCSSIATAMVAFSPHATSLYITRGIQGFCLGSFAPVAFAYTFELFPPQKRTLILALINTGFLIAGMLGQVMSELIEGLFHWRMAFFFFGSLYALLFIFSWRILPVPSSNPNVQHNVWKIFAAHLTNQRLFKCYAVTFIILLSFVSFYESIAVHFENQPNMETSSLLWVRGIGLIGTFLSLFTNRLIERFGEKKTLLFGLMLSISSLLAIGMYPHPLMIAMLSIFFVASISLILPSIITLIGNLAVVERASAISLYSFILLTGASIGPLLVASLSISSTMLLLASFFSISFLLILTIKG